MKRIALTFVMLSTAFLLAPIVQPARAQTITVSGAEEYISDDTFDQDGLGGGGDPTGPQSMDVFIASGTFNQSYSQTVPSSLGSSHGFISQNTTITTNGNSLVISGTFNSLNNGSGTHDDMGDYGYGSAQPVSSLLVNFATDQPFNYSLTVNISRSQTLTTGNPFDMPGSAANVQFGYNAFSLGSSNIMYGYYSGLPDDLYPKTGTNNGVMPASSCGLQVLMDNSASFNGNGPNAGDYSYDSSSTITFSLTISPITAAQAPVITSFTPGLAGTYQLGWTAPQAGNYRIVSSPDLVNWSEAVATTSYSAGANVNLVDALPDSSSGFYRVEYLGPSSP